MSKWHLVEGHPFSPRQGQIIECLANYGFNYKRAGRRLHCSPQTIKNHVSGTWCEGRRQTGIIDVVQKINHGRRPEGQMGWLWFLASRDLLVKTKR